MLCTKSYPLQHGGHRIVALLLTAWTKKLNAGYMHIYMHIPNEYICAVLSHPAILISVLTGTLVHYFPIVRKIFQPKFQHNSSCMIITLWQQWWWKSHPLWHSLCYSRHYWRLCNNYYRETHATFILNIKYFVTYVSLHECCRWTYLNIPTWWAHSKL